MRVTAYSQVRKLHSAPAQVVISCAGAGSGLQDLVLAVPGASRTLLHSVVPYSGESMVQFLGGHRPEKFCTQDVALRMAARSRIMGQEFNIKAGGTGENIIGLGLTAAVATNRVKRGEHRAYIATASDTGLALTSAVFEKKPNGLSFLGRRAENHLSDQLALNMLLEAAGIDPVPIVTRGFSVRRIHPRPLEKAVNHDKLMKMPLIWQNGTLGRASELSPNLHVLFGGSFDPFHFGHLALADEVRRTTLKEVVYVLNANHPDKGRLSDVELLRRAEQMRWLGPVLITEETGLFIEKAAMFPGFTFLIGADTLEGILNPKYYTKSVKAMLYEMNVVHQAHFLVVDRVVNGVHKGAEEILQATPDAHDSMLMFRPLGVKANITSSEIRRRRKEAK